MGKAMLAARLPTILPPLTEAESLETTRIYSATGRLGGEPLMTRRPFRTPHHTISDAGMVGSGNPPAPGEISLRTTASGRGRHPTCRRPSRQRRTPARRRASRRGRWPGGKIIGDDCAWRAAGAATGDWGRAEPAGQPGRATDGRTCSRHGSDSHSGLTRGATRTTPGQTGNPTRGRPGEPDFTLSGHNGGAAVTGQTVGIGVCAQALDRTGRRGWRVRSCLLGPQQYNCWGATRSTIFPLLLADCSAPRCMPGSGARDSGPPG
jgi:hypothetical protein